MKQKMCLMVLLLLAFTLCLAACDGGGVVGGLLGTETECDFCGETKKCKEKTIWGEEYNICNDCQEELGEAMNAEPASGLEFGKCRDNEKGIYYYQVEGPGTNLDKDLVIPATYKDLPVMGINNNAFEGCAYLTSVVIPKSVTYIDNSAFLGCKNITSIIIPDSVEIIYGKAFQDCTSLQKVIIGDGVKTIDAYAFKGCTALTELKIGKSVEIIEGSSFADCVSLEKVSIPASVQTIERAFTGCTNLKEVEILNEMAIVYSDAFSGCDALATVKIGEDITIKYGEENGEFRVTDISKLLTVQACEKFAPAAYHVYVDGKLLTELVIPDGVTEIPERIGTNNGDSTGFFSGWIGLKSVTIPESMKSIPGGAFCGCASLVSVVIHNGVEEIGDSAFGDCDGLTTVTFPASMNSVSMHPFRGSDNLTAVVFEDTEGWHYHPWGRMDVDVSDSGWNADYMNDNGYNLGGSLWYKDGHCSLCD